MNEGNWSDTDLLSKEIQDKWSFISLMALANVIAEKTVWKFSREDNIDLVTVIPALIAGNCPYSNFPNSFHLIMSLITGDEWLMSRLKEIQERFGSISFSHVDDVARAHLFLAEKEKASGRYICCSDNTSVPRLANFLRWVYPEYHVFSEIGESCSLIPKLTLSSAKIINEVFKFEHGMREIYDEMTEYFESKGWIKPKES